MLGYKLLKTMPMFYSRNILSKIKKVIPRDEFIILTGARQTGKTSLLIMLKDYCERKGMFCHYLNLENLENLKLLNKHPYNIFELISKSRVKQTVFIDEIQYLDNPTNFLKLLYDEKRERIKIIASGSSSFYLDKKFKDSLVGRKFLFEVFPLNFEEFLLFNKEKELLKQKGKKLSRYYQKRLRKRWEEFLIYGGYPKVALTKDKDVKKILLEEIGSSYLKKDIRDAGIKNAEKYFSLLKTLANQTGELVNVEELANTFQMAGKTVEEYLYIMKKSYQLAFIRPFFRNVRKELTKMPKVYFYDLGLRNFFLNNYEPIEKRPDKGAYLENILFKKFLRQTGELDKIKFWRTQSKNEVDFIIDEKMAYEAKFDLANFKESKYAKFRKEYPEIKFKAVAYQDILNELSEIENL